ncbi:histidine phosphatase superfamily [Paraphysoderma sedebokerense]|nr:histidine phosphatase superfamily [Paraphysoderma sedebokerense]
MNAQTPRILQGQADTSLNEQGHKQASRLAYRLKKEKFDHIYSSDLIRAKQTVKEIMRYHPDTPSTYDNRLREQNLGDLTGLPWPDAKAKLTALDLTYDDYLEKHCESTRDFDKRINNFYSDIVEKFLLGPDRVPLSRSEENLLVHFQNAIKSQANATTTHVSHPKRPSKIHHILIVTHGGWIQRLMRHIIDELSFTLEDEHRLGFPKNTGLYKFVIAKVFKSDGDYEWEGRVPLVNCVTHLAGISKYELVPAEELSKLEQLAKAQQLSDATATNTNNQTQPNPDSKSSTRNSKDSDLSKKQTKSASSLPTTPKSLSRAGSGYIIPPSVKRINRKTGSQGALLRTTSSGTLSGHEDEDNNSSSILQTKNRHRSASQEPSVSKKSAGIKVFGSQLQNAANQEVQTQSNGVGDQPRMKSLGW